MTSGGDGLSMMPAIQVKAHPMQASFAKSARNAIPLCAVTRGDLKRFLAKRSSREAAYLKSTGFGGRDGELRLVPNAAGGIASAVLGLGKGEDSLALAQFSEQLPAGIYRFDDVPAAAGGARSGTRRPLRAARCRPSTATRLRATWKPRRLSSPPLLRQLRVLAWGSASTTRTRKPASVKPPARLTQVVVFPTPPFWLAMAMTRDMRFR